MALSPDNPALTTGQAQPEGQPASPPVDGQTGQPPAPQEPAPQTPEEVEAIWRNRFSQRDRAHNAEVDSLRNQMEDLRRSVDAAAAAQPGAPAPDSYKARFEETAKALEQERALRVVTERRMRYPALAQEVAPEDPMWTASRDETLARLNATFSAPPPPPPTGHVDANNPPRVPQVQKDPSQMTKDELLDQLRLASPAEEARWRELSGG